MQLRSFSPLAAAASALVLAFTVAAGAYAQEQSDTESFDRTIAFHPGGTVKLDNFSGMVRITAADGDNVVIHAIRRAPRERLDHIKIDVQSDASTVTIQANRKDDSWRESEQQRRRDRLRDPGAAADGARREGVLERHQRRRRRGQPAAAHVLRAPSTSRARRRGWTPRPSAVTSMSPSRRQSMAKSISTASAAGSPRSQPIAVHTGSRKSRIHGDIGAGGDTQFHFKTFSGDVTLR